VFDVVLAAHMLYHVPDIGGALGEIRRVLRPGGTALLAANGAADKGEILDLWREAAAAVAPSFTMAGWARRFSVDADRDLDAVRGVFEDVEVDLLTGEFRFPTPAPVMAWANSLRAGTEDEITDDVWDAVAAEFEARAQALIDRHGAFVVHKSSGVIVAR
jgi:SAM-dependent methyltransferase